MGADGRAGGQRGGHSGRPWPSRWPVFSTGSLLGPPLCSLLAGCRPLLLCRGRTGGTARCSHRGSVGTSDLESLSWLRGLWLLPQPGQRTQALGDPRRPRVSHQAELDPFLGWRESLVLRGQEAPGHQVCCCGCGCGCIYYGFLASRRREPHCPSWCVWQRGCHPAAWQLPGAGGLPEAEVPTALVLPLASALGCSLSLVHSGHAAWTLGF